jgi:hypothetical protein
MAFQISEFTQRKKFSDNCALVRQHPKYIGDQKPSVTLMNITMT